jgi:hypothetical protein
MTKTVLTLTFLLLIQSVLWGQTTRSEKAKVLAVNVSAKKFIKAGDTITVRIKNLSSFNRGFTIEVVSLGKAPEYESAVYSAFFNADSLFFQKLRRSQALSKSKNVGYLLPDYELHPYEINGSEEKLLTFVVSGKSSPKTVRIKLRITSDIIDNESETVYSAPLTVLWIPN